MTPEEKELIDVDAVARSVGYGAVKYFDLKQHRYADFVPFILN